MRLLILKLWHLPTLPGLIQVPSAVRGLTALFGMGRGEHPPYQHHQVFMNLSFPEQSRRATIQISLDELGYCLNQYTDINGFQQHGG
jgi:hypothetical protein